MNLCYKTKQSALYEESVKYLHQLSTQEGSDTATRAYAEAVSKSEKKTWIEKYGLTQSSGVPCVQRLLGKNCGQTSNSFNCEGHAPPGNDHCSLWLKDGKPYFYIFQPYSLDSSLINDLLKFCKKYELEFLISTWPSWHFPGAALSVILRKKSQEPFHCNNL